VDFYSSLKIIKADTTLLLDKSTLTTDKNNLFKQHITFANSFNFDEQTTTQKLKLSFFAGLLRTDETHLFDILVSTIFTYRQAYR
jgi:hypothetical protein